MSGLEALTESFEKFKLQVGEIFQAQQKDINTITSEITDRNVVVQVNEVDEGKFIIYLI